ncbi:MAG: Ig-like domain-containing protein, partial [Candidatus Staskawiczbacteria bacterium]|nr:Ig-like domain-containing protein [Candidatus Staskawiczbacteria bacterium]
PTNSSISVSPSTVVADGQSIATIIVSCEDQYGNLIPGADVGVSVSGSDNTLAQPGAADKPGITTVNLSSTKAESKTVSVIVNNISIGKSDPINFVPGKIAKLLISADSPVATNHTSQITITGKDQFDNVAINDSASQVALSVDNGGSLDPALATFAKGIAVASLSKKTPGTVNLVASDGNINATSKIVFNSADSIAPVILSQYPSGGVESVPLNVIPYINFSKTMDATTINNDSVQLRKFSDDSPVPATISIANGLKQARLQPDSNLDSNTKYYLYVDVSASDQSGNSLAFIYNGGSFTTIKILRSRQLAPQILT